MTTLLRALRFLRRLCGHILRLEFSPARRELAASLRRLRLELAARRQKRAVLRRLKERVDGRRVIVLPPTLDWHLPLFQRPQQLARAYSEKPDTFVIYLTANTRCDSVAAAEEISRTLWLVNAALARELRPLLALASESVVSISWTANGYYIPLLRPDKVIYEYIDELEIFDGYNEHMRREHLNLMRTADLTVCTATRLYEDALPSAKKALLSPNAGDLRHFSRTAQASPSPELAEKARGRGAVLGYYGALAAWLDYALLAAAAEKRRDWLFVLIGMDYDGSLGRSGLLEHENVLWIPPQPYERLPEFLSLFDIALVPFVINDITLSTSPVKLFEYMAAEKPILSAALPECMKYESVATYSGTEDFLRKSEDLLARREDAALIRTLRREAAENTWAARTDEILRVLG